MGKPIIGIVMGSSSDRPIMEEAAVILDRFKVPYELIIASAHRSPERTREYARTAQERGLQVIIAGAGGAAHLAGSMAVGKAGARNAAILAVQILSLHQPALQRRLEDYKKEMAQQVEEAGKKTTKG
jgi:phosphoribosylcarboxyaminoimidazole (NCAIR) mutase